MFVAIDFGITNTDVVINQNGDDIFYSFPSRSITTDFIDYIFDEIDPVSYTHLTLPTTPVV